MKKKLSILIPLIPILTMVAAFCWSADTFQFRRADTNAVQGTIDTSNIMDMKGGYKYNGSTTLSNSISGNAGTATALAANGANCSAGQAAAGVDASGAAEGCFTPSGGGGDVFLANDQTFTGKNTFANTVYMTSPTAQAGYWLRVKDAQGTIETVPDSSLPIDPIIAGILNYQNSGTANQRFNPGVTSNNTAYIYIGAPLPRLNPGGTSLAVETGVPTSAISSRTALGIWQDATLRNFICFTEAEMRVFPDSPLVIYKILKNPGRYNGTNLVPAVNQLVCEFSVRGYGCSAGTNTLSVSKGDTINLVATCNDNGVAGSCLASSNGGCIFQIVY